MAVVLARVVSCEENLQAGYVDKKHCSAKDVPGRVGSDADGRDGVGGVVVNCFYHGEGGEVIGFSVELYFLLRGRGRYVAVW